MQGNFFAHVSHIALQFIVELWRDVRASGTRENAKVLASTEVNVKATHSPRVLYWCSHGRVCVWVPSPGQMRCRGAIFQEWI